MGLFDYFRPLSLSCPVCGSTLELHGKPAFPALYIWRENERHPIDQGVDPEFRNQHFHALVLSEDIPLTGRCRSCGHDVDATAKIENNVWSGTVTNPPPLPADPINGIYFLCHCCAFTIERTHPGKTHLCSSCGAYNSLIG